VRNLSRKIERVKACKCWYCGVKLQRVGEFFEWECPKCGKVYSEKVMHDFLRRQDSLGGRESNPASGAGGK
jgi:tRNA(Ile2) C34 agmatinyltransferase TiaS